MSLCVRVDCLGPHAGASGRSSCFPNSSNQGEDRAEAQRGARGASALSRGLPLLVAPPRTLPYRCGSRLRTRCVLCSRRSGRCPQPSGLLVARGRRGQTGGVEAAGPEVSASPSTWLAGVPPLCELGVLSGAGRRAAPWAPLPRLGLRWDTVCKGRAGVWAFDVSYALAGPLRSPRQLQASLCLRLLKSRLGERLPGGPQSRLGASCCLSLSSQAPFRGLQRSCSRKLSSTPSSVGSQGAALRERCPARGPAGAGTAPPPRGVLGCCGICPRPAAQRSLVARWSVSRGGGHPWCFLVSTEGPLPGPHGCTLQAQLRVCISPFSLLLMRHQLGP